MILKNNILAAAFILLASVFLFSCEKDDETANISRVTSYPNFSMTGEDLVVTWVGAGFTDPGVKAEAGGNDLPVTTTVSAAYYITPGQTNPPAVQYGSSFDAAKPGIYTFTYSATNEDGFAGTTTRTVIVLDKQPNPTVDLSGNYTSGTSPASVVTKVANGVFYATNFWGGGSTVVLDGYILTSDGINLNIPMQESQVTIYGYGKRLANGDLDLRMTRPTFSPPLVDQVKLWVKS
ncbi:immunoglobulin-like domain-containing protein [Adhaeribacter rhizoryzae]|uniref:DUF5011 domain-containing protein n=1 Tax=Adhaeribacter rhizoryzae TaxID=2607907 RepID=A0A5M6DM22_9BACT|nr:immunoglobulin-like domain-containing protein [Adhaeribacter rhizoryzae]KAA5548571.1 DUF5011 domain-containing protein [Adhaeribacter rhizoryzae]